MDEHGTKVQEAAERDGRDPQTFCDLQSGHFRSVFDRLGVGYDDFVRTTQARHAAAVTRMWGRLVDADSIYKGKYAGWYCAADEAFVAGQHVVEARGTDGRTEMLSAESGRRLEWIEEDNYMFRLTAHVDAVRAWVESPLNPIPTARYRDAVLATLTEGPGDLSVSRPRARVPWGLPVPGDPAHSVYVWLDALTNYLTTAGFGDGGDAWVARWPPHSQILGLDILKFHGVHWPALLSAAGLPLPRRLIVHAHWMVGGAKMSKSQGSVVDPVTEADAVGVDRLRYFLLRRGRLDGGASFSRADMTTVCDAELSNTVGNLASRAFAAKIVGGLSPAPDGSLVLSPAPGHDACAGLLASARARASAAVDRYAEADFRSGLEEVMELAREANRFFADEEPWVLARTLRDGETGGGPAAARLSSTLYGIRETLRVIGALLQPVTPALSARLLDRVGCTTPLHAEDIAPHCIGKDPVSLTLPTGGFTLLERMEGK